MEEPQLISFLKSEGELILDVQTENPSVHFCTGLAEEISQDGSHHLVVQYGSLLRIFKVVGNVDAGIIKAALQCLDDAIKKLGKEFKEDGGNIKDLERDRKQYLRKSLVVAIFMIFKSFHELEAQVHNDKQNQTITDAAQIIKRRGKKKAVQPTVERGKYSFWNTLRAKITSSVKNVLSCRWEGLWPEGNNAFKYMRCLTIAYCDVLKKAGEDLQFAVEESEDIFYILGILSSRADEEKSIVGRLIPLVKTSEEMSKLLCQCFTYIEENFEKGTIVESAVIEAANVYFAQLQTETSIERGFATFLTELALSNPQQLIKCLPSLITFLEAESSTVRSSVLVAGAEIIAWNKKSPTDGHSVGNENRIKSVLTVLLNHSKDINANVRSKALQLINKLINNKDIEGADLVSCLEICSKRLLDKGLTVRKQAIQLMVTIVTNHPLMVKFTNTAFREEIRKSRILVHEMLAKDAESKYQILEIVVEEFTDDLDMPDYLLTKLKKSIKDSSEGMKMIENALKNGSYWEACELFYVVQKEFSAIPHIQSKDGNLEKQLYMQYLAKSLQELFPGEQPMDLDSSQNFENIASSEQVLKKKVYIEYLKNLEEMSLMMEQVQQIMTIILDKGAPSDKEEVINFFSEIATIGFKPSKALTVSVVEALSQCKEIDDGILQRFCRLFLDDPSIPDARGAPSNLMLVRKLIEIVDLLSYSQRENIIPLILLLRKKKMLDNDCIQLFWDAFTLATPTWENKDSSSAVYLLGVLGQAESSIVTTNINRLVEIGLGPRGLLDFNLVKSSLESLLFVCKKPKVGDEELPDTMRFPASEEMFDKIISVIERGLREKGNRIMDENFCAVAELAIQLIYRLCIDPKVVIARLLEHLHDWVFGDGENSSQIKNSERLATRYLGVCTSLLGCELLFLESTVSNEVKRRRTLILKKDGKPGKGKKGKKTSANMSKSTVGDPDASRNASRMINKSASINESAVETNELDQITGANGNFENDADVIKKYVNGMLESGIHRQFRIHTLLYCNKINCYKSLRLKLVLIKAIAKIMSVAEGAVLACTDTFNTLWDKVDHPMVKVEILRAAILLNQRFPNQMEKCTKCVTHGLRDNNPSVKKAALDFITYLTLNDLLKVRGQLTEAALLVCDEDLDVREMARDFLKQCAEKDNVLMNAIPDIISRLTKDVDQELFRNILKYLLAQIKKDKQTTNMVETLLSRFTIIEANENALKMYQNTAFCLTQFPINEKSFKSVIEKLASYSDKLDDDFTYDCFVEIIKEARKNCKADSKAKIDEYEKDLQEAREKCVEMKRIEDAAAGRGPQESDHGQSSNENSAMEEGSEHSQDENSQSDSERPADKTGNSNKRSQKTDGESEDEVLQKSQSSKRGSRKEKTQSDEDSAQSESEDEVPSNQKSESNKRLSRKEEAQPDDKDSSENESIDARPPNKKPRSTKGRAQNQKAQPDDAESSENEPDDDIPPNQKSQPEQKPFRTRNPKSAQPEEQRPSRTRNTKSTMSLSQKKKSQDEESDPGEEQPERRPSRTRNTKSTKSLSQKKMSQDEESESGKEEQPEQRPSRTRNTKSTKPLSQKKMSQDEESESGEEEQPEQRPSRTRNTKSAQPEEQRASRNRNTKSAKSLSQKKKPQDIESESGEEEDETADSEDDE